MPTIRYTDGGRYRVAGRTFERGDEKAVDDATAAYLVEDVGDFEYVGTKAPPAEVPHVSSEDIADLLSGTVDEVAAALSTGDYDTALDRVADAEADGADRVGVREAIEARHETLAAEPEG